MADLNCPFCGEPVTEGAPICPSCGGPMLLAETRIGSPPQAPPAPVCPHCGAEIPDPANVVCVECLESFDPPSKTAAPDTVTGTRRDLPRTLVLDFPAGKITISPGGSAVLGRAPEMGPHAHVFRTCDNVSRRHATLGVEPNGAAWVRDEDSTNGTFVNGTQAEARARTSLHDGDILRLAADVEARVRLTERADG